MPVCSVGFESTTTREIVARSGVKSLWTPNIRWGEVTEEGFTGGTVVPDDYDGSQASLDQVRINIMKSGQVGNLVSNNFKSTIVIAPSAHR